MSLLLLDDGGGRFPFLRPRSLPRVTYTRTGLAVGVTPASLLYEVAANVPRFNAAGECIWEGQRTNSFPDARCETAAAGTPGTLPTGMFTSLGAGISQQVTGVGTLNGVPGFYIRFFGTLGSPQLARIIWGGTTTFAWATGASMAISLYSAVTSGTYPVGTSATASIAGFTGGGAATGNNATTTFADPTSSPAKFSLAGVSGASNAFGRPEHGFSFPAGTMDVTFFVGALGIELARAFSSTSMLPPVGVRAAATRGADTGVVSLIRPGAGGMILAVRPGQAAPASTDQIAMQLGTDADRLLLRCVGGSNTLRLSREAASGGLVDAVGNLGTQVPGTLAKLALTWDGAGNAWAKMMGGTWRTVAGVPTGLTSASLMNNVAGSRAWFGTGAWGDEYPSLMSEQQADARLAALPI